MDESKPFVLPGWDYGPGPAPSSPARRDRRSSPGGKRSWVTVVLWVLVVALMGTGAAAVYVGLTQGTEAIEAPVPAEDISVPADAPVRGDTGTDPDAEMTVEQMEPMHYFIPALGVYSQIVPSSGFSATRYADFSSIDVPDDPTKAVWYSSGGALAANEPGTSGTTLLASHLTSWGKWGVLRYLYTLEGGELVYVKDVEGQLSAWKVTELFSRKHTAFPQEFWSAEGERRLVLVTCGGYERSSGHYTQNVFAVAVPVEPETGEPLQLPEPEAEAHEQFVHRPPTSPTRQQSMLRP